MNIATGSLAIASGRVLGRKIGPRGRRSFDLRKHLAAADNLAGTVP